MPTPLQAQLRKRLRSNTDLAIAGLIVGIILMIIIPMPPQALDILLSVSITLGLVILLITMFTTEPLQFSVFPALLLVTTLYRLALNISSTRLILGQAYAGKVIDAFGHVVVSGNYIVGFIVFIIITVIQFVVITSGAGRVAEVAARFTLDAMPGKQMSIDAEFNAGLISEPEAREKRRRLQREADFFGAMDGASKFVRGDAIAGVIITLINIIGGLAIGTLQKGMPVAEAVQTYTILTIGDGLVTQVPAVLISTAAGILVTRATSDANFGTELSRQFTAFPKILFLVAGILFLLALIPAMPHVVLLVLAAGTGLFAYNLSQARQRFEYTRQEALVKQQMQEKSKQPENVATYFQVDPLQIEIGYNLIPLTDESQGGDLLARLAAVRRQCALELGIYVRPIRIRDNLSLPPNGYIFKLRGEQSASGELLPGYYLAMDPTGQVKDVPGIPTKEPTFGLPAWWVPAGEKEKLEMAGLTVVDLSTVLVTHLTEFIKVNAHVLLGRQEVKELLEAVKEKDPAVVEELTSDLLSLGEIQKVFQNLLKEGIPLRDLVTIGEALADGARMSRDTDFLTDHVRSALARTISRLYLSPQNKLEVITIHPKLEQLLIDSIQQTQLGAYPVLEPGLARQILEKIKVAAEKMIQRTGKAVVLCSPRARLPLRRLTERYLPGVAILSLNEIMPNIEVEVVGTVNEQT
ncbi:MAG: flagellar biosynthesis protein FlhA [Bacillota bacterium]